MTTPFTLRQLEYFDAIAGEGSLAAAAQRCRVSSQALALALDDLERHLGLQLFIRRKGKGVTLTPAGSRLLHSARHVLTEAEGLAADAWQASSSLSGTLTIGCFSTLAPFFLPHIVEDLSGEHPDLEVSVREGSAPELSELLLQGRVDVALLYQVDVSAELVFEPIRAYPPHVLVADDHPLARREGVHLRELIDEPMLMLDVNPTRQNTEQILTSLGLTPRISHVSSTYELVRCLVGRGLGYCIMHQRPATRETYTGHAVVQLPILDEVSPTVVGLARPAGAPRSARLSMLGEFLRSLTASAS